MGQLGRRRLLPILIEDNPPYMRKLVILGCWSPHPWLHDTQDQADHNERARLLILVLQRYFGWVIRNDARSVGRTRIYSTLAALRYSSGRHGGCPRDILSPGCCQVCRKKMEGH